MGLIELGYKVKHNHVHLWMLILPQKRLYCFFFFDILKSELA